MKVTILKKTIKEGVSSNGNEYKIRSLFVKFEDQKVYENIVKHLTKKGAELDQIEKFCKPREYKEVVNYAFGLNCSRYTFDRVEQFGELDAQIIFEVNERGFINAKINVIDRIEQILGYTEPSNGGGEQVEGWLTKAPEIVAVEKSELEGEAKAANDVSAPKVIPYEEEADDLLPF